MSSEIAQQAPQAMSVEKHEKSVEESLFQLKQRQAKAYASSTLVPKDFQQNIPNVLLAMELADRIGASFLPVVQNLAIIHGKPSLSASFLIATVNGSGRFSPLRYRMVGVPGTDDWGCYCVAKSKEDGEECIGPTITIAIAKAEGWVGKNGSKWKTMPELMLRYRAAAFWTRLFAPELSLGMQTSEEIVDVHESKPVPIPSLGAKSTPNLDALLEAPIEPKPTEETVWMGEES